MSDDVVLKMDEWTVGDLEDFEKVVGRSFTKEQEDMTAKGYKAIIWIIKRKDNPKFSLEDAAKVKFSQVKIEQDSEAVDFTNAQSIDTSTS